MKKIKFGSSFVMSLAVILSVGLFAVGAFAQETGIPEEYMVEENYVSEDVAPPAVVKNQSGSVKRFKAATSDDVLFSTTSTTFVPVPGMSRTFTTTAKGKMIITYSAVVYAPAGELMNVVATVDGEAAHPGSVQFTGDTVETWARSHSFTWVSKSYPPGEHTVEIMWQSDGGSVVWTHTRSMVVLYKQ